MSEQSIVRTLIEYHYALYSRLWGSIERLTGDQFVEAVPYSHGSVRDQIVHVAATDGRWLRGLQERSDARQYRLDPADFPDPASARSLWETTAQAMLDFVAGLDDAALQHTPRGMAGPAWHILLHVVNHGTDHRAQILRLLYDFGAPTFEQDLIMYLWQR